jgi:hypothetical protein
MKSRYLKVFSLIVIILCSWGIFGTLMQVVGELLHNIFDLSPPSANVFALVFPKEASYVAEFLLLLLILISAAGTLIKKNGARKLFIFMLFLLIPYLVANFIVSLSTTIYYFGEKDTINPSHIIGGAFTLVAVIMIIVALTKLLSRETKKEFTG